VQVGEWDFRRRDQEQFAVGDARVEQVLFELRQLAGARHRRAVHDHGDGELGVTVAFRVQVQQERGDRPFQAGAHPSGDGEPGARELGRAGEVEQAEALAEGDVVRGVEVERRGVAPGAHQFGVVLGVAVREGG
jgi:hypothetical protein